MLLSFNDKGRREARHDQLRFLLWFWPKKLKIFTSVGISFRHLGQLLGNIAVEKSEQSAGGWSIAVDGT